MIIPRIPNETWFENVRLSRKCIVQFKPLHVGHSLSPPHLYKLSLDDSPFYILHLN